MKDADGTADLWVALGDSRRREILGRLARRPCSVSELARELPISQPAVSQHLKVLRDAELVAYRAEGVRRVYQVRGEVLVQMRDELDRFWVTTLSNFERLAEEEAAQNNGKEAT